MQHRKKGCHSNFFSSLCFLSCLCLPDGFRGFKERIMSEPWVLYSGIAVWLGIGAYTVFLALGQVRLRRKIFQLEQLLKDNASS